MGGKDFGALTNQRSALSRPNLYFCNQPQAVHATMNKLSDLLDGYLNSSLSPDEEKELFRRAQSEENHSALKAMLGKRINDPETVDRLFHSLISGDHPNSFGSTDSSITQGIQRRVLLKLSIAALIFLLGAIGIWLLSRTKP